MRIRVRPARTSRIAATSLCSALACVLALPAQAGEPTVAELAQRLKAIEQRLGTASGNDNASAGNDLTDLDQRLRVIERKLELQAEESAARAASTPTVSLSASKGLSVKSPPPGDVEVKVKALVQADGRFFIGDEQVPQNDTFLFRRIQPSIEGTWGSLIGFRILTEFAGDSATINDAYLDLKFDPRATLRIGKFKSPVGLERLQSSGSTGLIELGLASELTPNRDLGLQLQGEFAGSTVSYALGVFNGAVDGRDSPTTNPDNEFEYAGRIFFEPWKNASNALSGLGFGVGASAGDRAGSGNNFLPRYRTPGQAQFFNYRSTVLADGAGKRWSPQAYYYRNAFSLLGEYVSSSQEVRVGAFDTELDHRAWQLTAGLVLTGEDAGYKGVARPNQAFTVGGAGWGAFELVARYGRLDIDDDAFPRYADPNVVAAAARSWGLGLNWYLTGNLKLVANYTQTQFDGGAAAGRDREDEKAFFTRAQLAF
ncbi:OprO/OprP family phosphate-selective porin [Lysobacter gummosus]|uniref:OprO/OprP family phosphate-selective porin n=1 Tax=Lysobacter gummosus TaxID=262324 RepID=A0ABY3XA37_9GAMM|nr:porin [Lysobacter gummosus]ALN94006.1 phosphate-selective porin O and P family protein [Lysobacter gummosus]UNP29443.1 OprO/OprP family phosphate-selective porin [Lysobacter gummosus]